MSNVIGGFFSECFCGRQYAIIQPSATADAIAQAMSQSMDVFRAGTGEQRCSVCDCPIFTPPVESLDADRNPEIRAAVDMLHPGEFVVSDFDQWMEDLP